MIRIHGTREKSGRVYGDCPPLCEVEVEQAFRSLVEGELKFGGRIKEASDTLLVTETRILGGSSIDVTYFEGSEEDMAPLLAVACAYEKVLAEQNGEVLDEAYDQMKKFGEKVAGSPLFVTSLAPLLIGQATLKKALDLIQDQ